MGESHAATRFSVISDLGSTLPTASNPVGPIVTAVANQIKAGQPDLILTTGDNCHDTGGGAPTGYYDIDVGQYFHEYIGGYVGTYGEGSPTNRFWPALGNHDYAAGLAYYQAFFPALGNQRYYDFTAGAAHFFVLDSSASDGSTSTSAQALWLEAGLAASTSPWNFVFVHQPPYTSSDRHSPSTNLRWDYKDWGADAVFAGHVHAYERMVVDGLTYFTTSAAGETLAQGFVDRLGDQSLYYYRADYGGMQVDVDGTEATFSFVTRGGLVLDAYTQAVQANEFTADGGSYNVAGNWQRSRVVSAPDAVALFEQPLAGPVTVDTPVTLGALALH
ncbi:MAG: metallophosphoesterase, partial [Planctomycetes bacterium]|nr:metallophosphoesterase [Planctomycetota bacterium]